MEFKPPTPGVLRAYAGWALSKRHMASDGQAVALHKFRDGCEELAEDFPADSLPFKTLEEHSKSVSGEPSPAGLRFPVRDSASYSAPNRVRVGLHGIAATIDRLAEPHECVKETDHHFSIQTQRCIWCNRTYRDVKSRAPEFF